MVDFKTANIVSTSLTLRAMVTLKVLKEIKEHLQWLLTLLIKLSH